MIALLLFAALLQPKSAEVNWPKIPDAFTAEEKAGLTAFVETGKLSRPGYLRGFESRLKDLKKKIPPSGPARKERLELIKTAERDLKLFEAGVTFRPGDISPSNLNKGQVGYLSSSMMTLTQAIDDRVELRLARGVPVVVLGVKPDNVADGEGLSIGFVVECIGTKQYTTVNGGTRSIYTFQKFPHMEKLREWEAIRIAEWEKTQQKKPAKK